MASVFDPGLCITQGMSWNHLSEILWAKATGKHPRHFWDFELRKINFYGFENQFEAWCSQHQRLIEIKIDEIRNQGIHFVPLGSDYYPQGLLSLETPPWLLMVKGNLESLKIQNSWAVVGARKITPEVSAWMHSELADALKRAKPAIVSGGARGVDSEALWIAIRCQLPSIIYFPSSLEDLYPSEWTELEKEFLACGGTFVSEFFQPTEFKKHFFYRRNKLIVAHSEKCLVLQAHRKSGSFMSGQFCGAIGRDVLTLPGAPWDQNFGGNLELVRCGASLIWDAQDLSPRK